MKTLIKIISFSVISLWILGIVPLNFAKVEKVQAPTIQKEETAGDMSKAFKALSLLGTSASPVNRAVTQATTSAIYKIDEAINQVNFNLRAVTASSTAKFNLFIEQSNDLACNTTNTATSSGIIAGNINWFDAYPQTSTSGNVITVNAATTTYSWTPGGNGRGTAISLTNVNAECLRLTIGTASTTYYVEARAKANN